MITSKSIKLLVTKNQSHTSFSKSDIVSDSNALQDYDIQDLELTDQFNQEQQADKDMFTIREEESYEYDSEGDSACKKNHVQSQLDTLSTIRAESQNHLSVFHFNKQAESNKNLKKHVNNENIIMGSVNAIHSKQFAFPHIQAWQQKINDSQENQSVQQQALFVLKSSEKALKLDKIKVHKTRTLYKKYLTINLTKVQEKLGDFDNIKLNCCKNMQSESTFMLQDIQNEINKNIQKKNKITKIKVVKGLNIQKKNPTQKML